MGDPGTPRVTMGNSAPTPAALAADWGEITPSMAPLPYFSGFLEYCRAMP